MWRSVIFIAAVMQASSLQKGERLPPRVLAGETLVWEGQFKAVEVARSYLRTHRKLPPVMRRTSNYEYILREDKDSFIVRLSPLSYMSDPLPGVDAESNPRGIYLTLHISKRTHRIVKFTN